MPRIPDQLLNCVAFLFSSQEGAATGKPGGSGFFVRDEADRTFLVTNIHVAAQCRFAKVNGRGGAAIMELESHLWHHHPDGDDVSIQRVRPDNAWDIAALPLKDFLATDARMTELNAGVGDEVFMLGRFVAHEGATTVQPLARFGNIAMMPGEPVRDGRNLRVQAFLVEMRSLSGFSGSPVFIYMGPGTYRGDGRMMPFYSETIGLIGIDAGHKSTKAPVDGGTIADGASVHLNTGVSIVVPYFKIRELIDAT